MVYRIIRPMQSNSFFLFGPRGSGKTTFLKNNFPNSDKILWIDLLDPSMEDLYAQHPETLSHEIKGARLPLDWVIIDEIQKVPKLLNLVHFHIEDSELKFALTGSSARKLKKGAANLLAGRAFVNYLFPLTHVELGDQFNLHDALQWGTLPKITQLPSAEEKNAYLRAYALTYLKEEVWGEHIIRHLDPFRKFLEISAQCNGQIVNYHNIAIDAGVDTKTVQSYFEILEDTLVGFSLEPFHQSIRKRQRKNPKFFFFDTGVKRALEKTLTQPLLPKSYGYGQAFEHFLILEIQRLNIYYQKDFSLSYLRTKDDAEVDLIIERPGQPTALIEIKSTDHVDERDVRTLSRFVKDFKNAQAYCLSCDPRAKKIGEVSTLPWEEGIKVLGLVTS